MMKSVSKILVGRLRFLCLSCCAVLLPAAQADDDDWHHRQPPYGWYPPPPPPVYVYGPPVYPLPPPPVVYYPRWPQVTIGLPPLVIGVPFGGGYPHYHPHRWGSGKHRGWHHH
jgi:hypothetical protein